MFKLRNSLLIEMTGEEVAAVEAASAARSLPAPVSALQGLRAVDAAGMAGAFDAWANDSSRTFLERAFISKAITWRWDDPELNAGCVALGLTEQTKAELFMMAASL